MNQKLVELLNSYLAENNNILGGYVEVYVSPQIDNVSLTESVEIIVTGMNFAYEILPLHNGDIHDILSTSLDKVVSKILCDYFESYDADDDFYSNTINNLSDMDEVWGDYLEEELLDFAYEDMQIFQEMAKELKSKYDL